VSRLNRPHVEGLLGCRFHHAEQGSDRAPAAL
jgi:hypothetical protein